MILDQRHMSGPEVLESVEQVEGFWESRAREHGFRMRLLNDGDSTRELRRSRTMLAPRVDGGRWVADCPRCNSGIALWPENPRACCLGCGTIYGVEWPDAELLREGAAALETRPLGVRSWDPAQQAPDELREENVLHGHAPSDEASSRLSEVAAASGVGLSDVRRVFVAAGINPDEAEG